MTAPADTPAEYTHHGHKHPYHLVDPSMWPFLGAGKTVRMPVLFFIDPEMAKDRKLDNFI